MFIVHYLRKLWDWVELNSDQRLFIALCIAVLSIGENNQQTSVLFVWHLFAFFQLTAPSRHSYMHSHVVCCLRGTENDTNPKWENNGEMIIVIIVSCGRRFTYKLNESRREMPQPCSFYSWPHKENGKFWWRILFFVANEFSETIRTSIFQLAAAALKLNMQKPFASEQKRRANAIWKMETFP